MSLISKVSLSYLVISLLEAVQACGYTEEMFFAAFKEVNASQEPTETKDMAYMLLACLEYDAFIAMMQDHCARKL